MKLRSVWKSNRGHLTVWNHLTRTPESSSCRNLILAGFSSGSEWMKEEGRDSFSERTSPLIIHIRFNLTSFTDMKVFRRRKKNAAKASKCNLSRKKTVWTVSLTSLSHQNFSRPARRSLRPPVLILIEFNFILQIRWPRSNSSHQHQHQCVLTYVCVCVCVVLFVQHGTEQKGNIDFMASYIIK